MKVAIIGGGLAGLSSAFILEQFGIYPVIFEEKRQIGDKTSSAEILLSILTKPINDCFLYLLQKFGLELEPADKLSRHIFISKNNHTSVEGNLGVTVIRGSRPDSLENQLAKKLASKIKLNSSPSYYDLESKFSHIVLATGNATLPANLYDFQDQLFEVSFKGANIKGSFMTDTIITWQDHSMFPKGYSVLTPFSKNRASIVSFVPSASKTSFDNFYYRACSTLNQNLKIEEEINVKKQFVELSPFSRQKNTYLTGNCLGTILPIPGFDIFKAMLTGALAGYSIAGKINYERTLKPLRQKIINLNSLKNTMAQLDNNQFDTLISGLNLPFVKTIFHTKKDVLNTAGYIMKLI